MTGRVLDLWSDQSNALSEMRQIHQTLSRTQRSLLPHLDLLMSVVRDRNASVHRGLAVEIKQPRAQQIAQSAALWINAIDQVVSRGPM